MKNKLIITLLISVFMLAACAPLTPGSPSATATSLPKPTDIPTNIDPTPTHIAVDLTPAQRAAIAAAAKRYNVPVEVIKILSTEAVTWPSGCLGVVLPGVMCTQNQVEGFRIIMEAKGERFEFHTNQDGTSAIDAAQQLGTLQFAVFSSDGKVKLVNPGIGLGPTYNPSFNGFLPAGGSTAGTAYVVSFDNGYKALAVDSNGSKVLDFIKKPNYGLALWRGGQGVPSKLAWGTQPSSDGGSSALMIANVDGSGLQTLLTQDFSTTTPVQLVAEFWSADGQSLYFSKEPYGIGGYILFGGASNLFRIDITSKKVTELIPLSDAKGPMICLDALSGDYRYVADHCSQKDIVIRELNGGKTSTIQPPADVNGYNFVGSARFSPDGSRIAFAMGKGNPDDEQGWVAVSDSLNGGSKLVLTSPAGRSMNVVGWLSDQTLLVQSTSLQCGPVCATELWTVGADGSNPMKVADGSFLTAIDNR